MKRRFVQISLSLKNSCNAFRNAIFWICRIAFQTAEKSSFPDDSAALKTTMNKPNELILSARHSKSVRSVAAGILFLSTVLAQGELKPIVLEYNTGRPYLTYIATLPGTGALIPYYDEDGFMTKPLGPILTQAPYGMAIYGPGTYPQNGTAHIKLLSGNSYEVFGMKGEIFAALSIDLAEYSTVFPVPKTIGFIGTKADGSLVRTSFRTDGKIGPSAPGGGFETFLFPASFQDLVNLRAANDLFALDNLKLWVVSAPPVIVEASASMTVLWPPNRKMIPIRLDARVEGGAGESAWRVVGIECNETCPDSDMQITDEHTVSLRAARSGKGTGRVYTVWLQATDKAEQSSEWFAVEVFVMHDAGAKP